MIMHALFITILGHGRALSWQIMQLYTRVHYLSSPACLCIYLSWFDML
jgi:hypothetical protein